MGGVEKLCAVKGRRGRVLWQGRVLDVRHGIRRRRVES